LVHWKITYRYTNRLTGIHRLSKGDQYDCTTTEYLAPAHCLARPQRQFTAQSTPTISTSITAFSLGFINKFVQPISFGEQYNPSFTPYGA
jgi:hypothetical protein